MVKTVRVKIHFVVTDHYFLYYSVIASTCVYNHNVQIEFLLWLTLEPSRLVSPVPPPLNVFKEIHLFDIVFYHERHDIILQLLYYNVPTSCKKRSIQMSNRTYCLVQRL